MEVNFSDAKKEYPLLSRYYSPKKREPGSVHIKQVDEHLLDMRSLCYYHDGHIETQNKETVSFALKDKNLLCAVYQNADVGDNKNRIHSKGETVRDAIQRLGIADELKYILVDHIYRNGYEYTRSATIYIIP